MAINGLSGHVSDTSALPPIAEAQAPKSAFTPISSASPPGADLPGGVVEGPFLTQLGHRIAMASRRLMKSGCYDTRELPSVGRRCQTSFALEQAPK